MDWDWYAALHHRNLFNANIFYPTRDALAFSEHMVGLAIALFPFYLFGLAPLTIHNIGVLLGFAGCGLSMYALCRYATRSFVAGVIGGIAFAFVGFRFHHLPHLHFIWAMWLPLLLLTLLLLADKPTALRSLAFCGVFVMNGLTSLHWLVFGSTTIAITAIVLSLLRVRAREWRFWILLMVSTVAAVIILLPFVLPYRSLGMQRTEDEVLPNSAQWPDWLEPNYQNKLYGDLSSVDAYTHERTLFPGYITIALALVGLLASGRRDVRVIAIVWIVVGAVGARGLRGYVGSFLFHHFAVFRGIRMPARWSMIAYVGLALLGAAGMERLLRDRSRISQIAITSIAALALLFELRIAPIRWYLVPLQPRPLYDWIGSVPLSGAVLELPMTQSVAYEYLWRSTVHHKPLINGVSSYIPAAYEDLTSTYESDPLSDDFLSALERRRCSLIVVHAGILRQRSSVIRQWLRRSIDSGRLTFVREFDAGARADYVFALNRVEPEAISLRAPAVADSSGRTPSQNVRIFIDQDGPTYCGVPFANVDHGPFGIIHGKLTVSGWALAPNGVSAVNLRFANGRVVVRTDSVDRPDVKAIYPWYPAVQRPGFTKTIDRPLCVDGHTDMQLEIVDGRGRVVRNPPFWFTWRD